MNRGWEIASMMMAQLEFVLLTRSITLKPTAYLKEWISWFLSANFLAIWNLLSYENCLKSALFLNSVVSWIEVTCTEAFVVHEQLNVRDDLYRNEFLHALVDSSTLVACKSRLGKKSLLRAHHFGPLVFERIIFTFTGSGVWVLTGAPKNVSNPTSS